MAPPSEAAWVRGQLCGRVDSGGLRTDGSHGAHVGPLLYSLTHPHGPGEPGRYLVLGGGAAQVCHATGLSHAEPTPACRPQLGSPRREYTGRTVGGGVPWRRAQTPFGVLRWPPEWCPVHLYTLVGHWTPRPFLPRPRPEHRFQCCPSAERCPCPGTWGLSQCSSPDSWRRSPSPHPLRVTEEPCWALHPQQGPGPLLHPSGDGSGARMSRAWGLTRDDGAG